MTEHMMIGIAALIAAGMLTGYGAGLFGIGGGAVLVPVFLGLFPLFGVKNDVVMHSAIGTCLALVLPAALASTFKHAKLGNLDLRMVRGWLPWVAVGAAVGIVTVNLLNTHVLKIIFTVYLFLTASYVAIRRASEDDGSEGAPPTAAKVIGGTVIGNLCIWLGLGGGTFTLPFFRAFHYPMKKSIAVSASTGLVIGTGGAIGAIVHGLGVPGRAAFSLGYINGLAFMIVAPLMFLMAPIGAKAAFKAPDKLLKWVYVPILLALGVFMAFKTF